MNENLINKCSDYDFKSLLKKKGFSYFEKGTYNLNIIGVRSKGNNITNKFDDVIIVDYKDKDEVWNRELFVATTDPGLMSMKSFINKKGCAILAEGQYRSCYRIGFHKAKYRALVQCKPVIVYRDRNKNNKYDFDPQSTEVGNFGINIHHAGINSVRVDNWSAGCQVIAKLKDFDKLMKLAFNQIESGNGDKFTYTLLKEEDLV